MEKRDFPEWFFFFFEFNFIFNLYNIVLEWFFSQSDKKFWEDGIKKLPEKWQKIVEQNSE